MNQKKEFRNAFVGPRAEEEKHHWGKRGPPGVILVLQKKGDSAE